MRGYSSSMGIYPTLGRSEREYSQMGDLNLNLPTLSQILSSAETGVEQQVASNLAQSSSVQTAAQTAAGNALGTNIMNFYTQNPVLAWTITAGVALFVVYGLMSFAKPGKA